VCDTRRNQGSWVLPARVWLPAQVLNYGLAILGTQRFQVCGLCDAPTAGVGSLRALCCFVPHPVSPVPLSPA
jgi:hypothetical protein